MQGITYNTYCLKKTEILRGRSMEDLPEKFDVIIIGTDIQQSILAAALARNGHSVLHLDSSVYYGGESAAFSWNGLQEWIESQKKYQIPDDSDFDPSVHLDLEEEFIPLLSRYSKLSHFESSFSESEKSTKNDKLYEEDSKTKLENDENDNEKKNEEDLKKTNLENEKDTKILLASEQSKNNYNEENPKKTLFENELYYNEEDPKKTLIENELNYNEEDPKKTLIENELNYNEEDPKRTLIENEVKTKENNEDQRIYLEKNSRHFNIDLMPKVLFTRGPMVDLLISSNISRYLEFKALDKILVRGKEDSFEVVPCSRADVFTTDKISMTEKRLLMRFLKFVLTNDESNESFSSSLTFLDFLEAQQLTEKLINFVLHSIAFVDPGVSALVGLAATHRFLSSLGRFNNVSTPFLFPCFGSGELPQAFCRLCAVFGGVYILGRRLQGVIRNKTQIVSVLLDRRRIACKFLVVDGDLLPSLVSIKKSKRLFRQISIHSTSSESFNSLYTIPHGHGTFTFIHELSSSLFVCPKNCMIRHISSEKESNTKNDKSNHLPTDSSSDAIWSLRYTTNISLNVSSQVKNLIPLNGLELELDYESIIKDVKRHFSTMYPEEEFLPRAPDPEELIIGDE